MIAWRDAGPTDAPTLAGLGAASFAETFGHLYRAEDLAAFLATHTPERWASEIADPAYAIRFGEIHGEAVAYAKLGPPALPFTPKDGAAIELRQFYILKPHQGTGAAATLMDWTIATARDHGAEALYLSVFVDNHRARRFYQRYGFERVGTYAFMVGSHADEDDVMRLAL